MKIRKQLWLPLGLTVKQGAFLVATSALLAFVYWPVGCPACGVIEADNISSQVIGLKMLSAEAKLVAYRREHAWCANTLVSATYRVQVSIANTDSSAFEGPVLIKGHMSEKIKMQFASALGYETKIIQVKVSGLGTIEIIQDIDLWAAGVNITFEMLAEPVFSLVVDPSEIISNCTLCGGKQIVGLPKALKWWLD